VTMHPLGGGEGELDWVSVPTIGDLLVRGAATWGNRPIAVFPDVTVTYRQLLDGAVRRARALLALGVDRGDRVGVLMPNCVEHLEVQLACALVDACAVMINGRYKVDELVWVLQDAEPTMVVTSDRGADFVDYAALLSEAARVCGSDTRLVMVGDAAPDGFLSLAELEALAEEVSPSRVHDVRRGVTARSAAIMMYTSGTTSRPTGVLQSHDALVRVAMAASQRWRLTDGFVSWMPLPLFHIGGIFPLLSHMVVGGTLVMQYHFDPAEALDLIVRHRCEGLFPQFITLSQALVQEPAFAGADLSAVRTVHHNGDADTLRLVQSHFPQASVVSAFGMTETCGSVAWGDPDDTEEARVTTSGFPIRGAQVKLLDAATNEPVATGEVGEIYVRTPGVLLDYHHNAAKSAEAFREGWFYTGDTGRFDAHGRLTYVGRTKEMLKVGGENVAPAEIEGFLLHHPAIKICAVVGVPDAKYAEVPAAFVEVVDGEHIEEAEVVAFMRGRVASFKIPRYVRFVDDWPMSATKVRKDVLRSQLMEELEAGTAEPLVVSGA
jgi:fatty-acyl-CoA synthase